MPLKIEERQVDEVTLLELEGRLMLGEEVDALRQYVKNLLAACKTRIVVRLTKVDRLDSSGLGVLLASVKSARTAGGDLRLLQPSKQTGDVLDLLGLRTKPDVVRIFLDEQEALASFPPTLTRSGIPPV
ncbi:MAG: STAS domain-containing protein [Candidatus Acidiferrales bacterium]